MRKGLQRLLLVMLVAIVLPACGGSPDVPSTEQPAPLPARATEAPAGIATPLSPTEPGITPPSPTAVPAVATSRGPSLEATDPVTVVLDQGGLQLVEFFRFT